MLLKCVFQRWVGNTASTSVTTQIVFVYGFYITLAFGFVVSFWFYSFLASSSGKQPQTRQCHSCFMYIIYYILFIYHILHITYLHNYLNCRFYGFFGTYLFRPLRSTKQNQIKIINFLQNLSVEIQ